MAVQPVLGFHVIAGFCIDITAAREHRYEQISYALCSSNRIVYRDSISGGNVLVKGPVDIGLATSNTLRIVWREQRALSAILRWL